MTLLDLHHRHKKRLKIVDYQCYNISCNNEKSRSYSGLKKQIFVDVSELAHNDFKTGIQRVVRSILWYWLVTGVSMYRIEPVYSEVDRPGYKYAKRFTRDFLGLPSGAHIDEPITFCSGDIFIALDLQHSVIQQEVSTFSKMKLAGVELNFVVYDLLPILHPHFFETHLHELHDDWLNIICKYGRLLCISKSVADEVKEWVGKNLPSGCKTPRIDWFHLGADIQNSLPSQLIPNDTNYNLAKISECPVFLMVATIEPRKGHGQVLDAFENLWLKGAQLNLVIAGKKGWLVEDLCHRIRNHPELHRRLFWLEGLSDEYLEKVYASSTCLIAASYGEGFGLPLIEAAQHGLPILARDIPVFREVAGEYAAYFKAQTPFELARAIQSWLVDYENATHPKSNDIKYLTWKESSAVLLNMICQRGRLS